MHVIESFTDTEGCLNTIIEHKKEYISEESNIRHKVIVKSLMKPIFRDIAIAVGYHPFGYNSKEILTTNLDENKNSWMIIFTSWNNCG